MKAELNFHGVTVHVTSVLTSVIDDLRHDFSFFIDRHHTKADLTIDICPEKERALLRWLPLLRLGKSTFYLSGWGERRVKFLGRNWVRYLPERGIAKIYAADGESAYETLYSLILSFVGERLSLLGLQRIHGLGIEISREGAICLAPSGGGKSTLLLSLLKSSDVKVYSDDTPLLTSDGRMVPFPQRIALENAPSDVPEKFMRKFRRVHHREKFVVGSDYFASQIGEAVNPTRLILLKFSNDGPKWTPLSRAQLIGPLLRWLIVGHETPQIWEFFLRFSVTDFRRKLQMLKLRLRCLVQLLRETEASEFALGDDAATNANFLRNCLLNPV